jgi:hypothetical protein
LTKAGVPVFLIGGSEMAAELDAKRAIDQGTRLAAIIEDAKTGAVSARNNNAASIVSAHRNIEASPLAVRNSIYPTLND